MIRALEPEWLDTADSADPRARRCRRELALVNIIMGNAAPVAEALRSLPARPRIADLGGGDGRFMLRIARRLRREAELTIVDRVQGISTHTVRAFERLDWTATSVVADAVEWLERAPAFDAVTANLFLHHFDGLRLRRLLALASQRARLFIACEPRRSRFALAASHGLRLLGCGAETLHDAVVSVRAGFRGTELGEAWPSAREWSIEERESGLFSHLFIARRREAL